MLGGGYGVVNIKSNFNTHIRRNALRLLRPTKAWLICAGWDFASLEIYQSGLDFWMRNPVRRPRNNGLKERLVTMLHGSGKHSRRVVVRSWLNPLIWMPTLLGLLIVFSITENVFEQHYWIRKYVEFVSSILPTIEIYAKHSGFPNITRVYLSAALPLAFIQVPAFFLLYAKLYAHTYVDRMLSGTVGGIPITRSYSLPLKYWSPFALLLFVPIYIIAWFFMGKDPSTCVGCTNANRVGMVLFHSFFAPLGGGALLALLFAWLRNFRVIYFH